MARKRGMQYIPYDYEAAYNKAMEDMHEWFIENLFQHRKKVIYALKEITAGDQFEIEIYPQFRSMDEVPPEGRTIKKDNNKAQKNLNDKNARKYVERLINENFSDRDIWMTLTYDDEHLPPDGDVDAAIKNVQKYIRRINYQRKKRGLPNAKYVYVTAYNPDAEIRWHHHIVIRIRHLKRMHRIRERKERHDKKVSGLFMKRVVFTLILAAFIFTVVMIFVFLRMGSEPSTLIENVFRFLSVEGGAMALIKSVKTVKGTKSNGEIQHNDEPEQDDEEVQG